MHRARQHSATQTRERRQRLAHEAARLMAESGISDYQQARQKAAIRLGIHDDASLPRNADIEEALRARQRLFARPGQLAGVQQSRRAAIEAMEFLQAFSPRLVGPVLEGTAESHTPVQLHLHSDDPDAVQHFLQDQHIPAEQRGARLRLDKQRSAQVPLWRFSADGVLFELTVLPYDALRQAPLAAVDDKPMRRASRAQLQALLDAPPEPGWRDG